ncbi:MULTISPECIES: chromosomal replication initiator protein DnaA [unclassified Bradyrhizobium]
MAAAKENFEAYKGRLREVYGTDIYTAWFQSLKLDSMVGSKLVLSVPTRFLKSWIQSHYIDGLLNIWREIHPTVSVVEIQVRSPIARPATQNDIEIKGRSTTSSVSHFARPAATAPDRAVARTSLDARHTFATFVCGESNRLALNAAKLAASVDAVNKTAFNPLYIYGGVGLGKTHLLQAIAADNPGRALYVTAESFMYNFIGTAQNRGLDLKSVLANVDILLMDDLQFLQGKSTVTELALIVNAMIDAGRQVIVAADRSPGQLDCQDERLASRLKAGYCVEISNPEQETRLGILSSHLKSDYPSMAVTEDVLEHLSGAIVTTGRDLVGALNHINTASRLANQTNQPVTMDMAEAAIRQITEAQPARRVKIEDIQKVVSRFYKISKDDMISARRTSNVVRPRQIAIYLAKSLTLRSLPEIGRRFGGRDHTTILHAVRKIEALVTKDETLENEVSTLKRLIGCPA